MARLLAQFCLLHSLLTPTHRSLWGARLLPGHLPPPGLRRPGPVGQESGDSYKSQSSPAQLRGLRTHLSETPAGLAPGGLAEVPFGLGRPWAQWGRQGRRSGQRGCLGWCGVSGPSAAASRLCELQPGGWPSPFPNRGPPSGSCRTVWSRV